MCFRRTKFDKFKSTSEVAEAFRKNCVQICWLEGVSIVVRFPAILREEGFLDLEAAG